jgi:hypothetical protein
MSTFEAIRFCKESEFKYFEEERRELLSLQAGELCVAMFRLRQKSPNGSAAVALPLQIINMGEDEIVGQCFNSDKKLKREVEIKIIPKDDDYIQGKGVLIVPGEIPIDAGYIRDHHDGLDGTPLDVNISNEVIHKVSRRCDPVYA